jgi:hypothetical protein
MGSRNMRLMCYKSPGVEDGKSTVRPLSPEGMATACRYQAGPQLSSRAARPAERWVHNSRLWRLQHHLAPIKVPFVYWRRRNRQLSARVASGSMRRASWSARSARGRRSCGPKWPSKPSGSRTNRAGQGRFAEPPAADDPVARMQPHRRHWKDPQPDRSIAGRSC